MDTQYIPDTPEEAATYIQEKIRKGVDLIEQAVQLHKPRAIYGLMSGGDDSLPACYVASLHPQFTGIIHVNTGFGVKRTREHVQSLCASQGWPLVHLKAEDHKDGKGNPQPIIYRDIVLQNGFPGPSQHGIMYNMLKERQLRCFEREQGFGHKEGERVLYVSGVREKESARRSMTVKNTIDRIGRRVWVAAIHDWTRLDCRLAREHAKLHRNPVSAEIGMSGECLCGAFAEPGELDRLTKFCPEEAQTIRDLEREAKAAGFSWGWEDPGPPQWWSDLKGGQCHMDFGDLPSVPAEMQHLCVSCNKRGRGE